MPQMPLKADCFSLLGPGRQVVDLLAPYAKARKLAASKPSKIATLRLSVLQL